MTCAWEKPSTRAAGPDDPVVCDAWFPPSRTTTPRRTTKKGAVVLLHSKSEATTFLSRIGKIPLEAHKNRKLLPTGFTPGYKPPRLGEGVAELGWQGHDFLTPPPPSHRRSWIPFRRGHSRPAAGVGTGGGGKGARSFPVTGE